MSDGGLTMDERGETAIDEATVDMEISSRQALRQVLSEVLEPTSADLAEAVDAALPLVCGQAESLSDLRAGAAFALRCLREGRRDDAQTILRRISRALDWRTGKEHDDV